MPTLSISTNVPLDGVKASDILKAASKSVARTLGKPESYVMVLLNGSVPMSFAGTEEPAAFGELSSIGAITGPSNAALSKVLAELLQSQLSVPPNRFYIKFNDVKGSNFGYNGTTF